MVNWCQCTSLWLAIKGAAMTAVAWMDRTLYPNHPDEWDEWAFRERILAHVRPDSVMLDLGAGAGVVGQMNFRGAGAHICGIDPDPRVKENLYLDEARIGSGENIPYPDNSFDIVFSCNVLEHLADPAAVFKEVHRVLKPGGVYLVKTPNRWHYVAMLATLTPLWFHRLVKRRMGRDDADTFPTLYRANSRRALQRLAQESSLSLASFERTEGRPEYLRRNPVTYVFGWLYERSVNLLPGLHRFRVVILAEMRKGS